MQSTDHFVWLLTGCFRFFSTSFLYATLFGFFALKNLSFSIFVRGVFLMTKSFGYDQSLVMTKSFTADITPEKDRKFVLIL